MSLYFLLLQRDFRCQEFLHLISTSPLFINSLLTLGIIFHQTLFLAYILRISARSEVEKCRYFLHTAFPSAKLGTCNSLEFIGNYYFGAYFASTLNTTQQGDKLIKHNCLIVLKFCIAAVINRELTS